VYGNSTTLPLPSIIRDIAHDTDFVNRNDSWWDHPVIYESRIPSDQNVSERSM
jgi:hypothetical protein